MTNNKSTLSVLLTVAVLVAGAFTIVTTFEDAEATKPSFAESDNKKLRVALEDLGILQLVAHDLFNVNRNLEVDFENGKLDLSTLFDHGDENIAIGGEFRNRENIMLFTTASEFGKIYLDFLNQEGIDENDARQMTIELYHQRIQGVYERMFGEIFPSPQEGKVTMTENLAFRTIHDLIPGKTKIDGKMTHILDSSLIGKKLSNSELEQLSSKLDGKFDREIRNIDIVIDGVVILTVDLLEADISFGEQFSTDFSFEYFLDELKDGHYDNDEQAMNQIRNLIAKGLAI
jgi:hypothetical protein